MKKYNKFKSLLLLLWMFVPGLVFGQTTPAPSSGTTGPSPSGPGTTGPAPSSFSHSVQINNPLNNQTLMGLLQDVLDVIMVFAVPIIVLFIIYAGFLYVTAQGNETQVSKATKALLYAVVGGVIILGAQVLLDVIAGTIAAF